MSTCHDKSDGPSGEIYTAIVQDGSIQILLVERVEQTSFPDGSQTDGRSVFLIPHTLWYCCILYFDSKRRIIIDNTWYCICLSSLPAIHYNSTVETVRVLSVDSTCTVVWRLLWCFPSFSR